MSALRLIFSISMGVVIGAVPSMIIHRHYTELTARRWLRGPQIRGGCRRQEKSGLG